MSKLIMPDEKLKTAILGLNEKAFQLLGTISTIDHFKILAVADKDTELAKKTADQFQCNFYDDCRQMIIQNQLDCLIVAAGIHSCDEYLKMAIKKKFNILKLLPPARNFEEAFEFVKLAEEQNVKFAVANTNRVAQSSVDFQNYLRQNKTDRFFLITALCALENPAHHPWRTDPKLAGGGVLLYDCYQLIDQILCNFDMPQQVYALKTNTASDRQQRLYLTEDTALVTMKFTDHFFANIIASKRIGQQQQFIKLYAKDNIVTVDDNSFTVTDHLGKITAQTKYDEDESARLRKLLQNFAETIHQPEENKLICSAAENLKNMAVIEAAYLSTRTGFPEQPMKILEMEQTEAANLWPAN